MYSWAGPSKAKTPVKAFKTASARLSASYLKNHKQGKVQVQVEPIKQKIDLKKINNLCSKAKIECQIFQDFANPKLINLTLLGGKKPIDQVLGWIKSNSQKYQEFKHKNK